MPENAPKHPWLKAEYFLPLLLLVLPLFSYPLLWQKLLSPNVPMWGETECVTLQVIGIFAFSALCFVPGRLRKLWQYLHLRVLLLTAAAGIAVAVIHHFLYGGVPRFICSAGFYFLLPIAGIVFSGELKRLFPLYAGALLIPVATVTCRSSDLSGWAGNWNWNFSLLAITVSGVFFLFPVKNFRRIFWSAVVTVSVMIALISCFHFEKTPRGTIAGMLGATVCLLVFRNIHFRRRWAFAVWAAVLTLVLFMGSAESVFAKIRDSRFQLWRGSLDFILAKLPFGVGPDRFENMINPFLPEIYHFTPFAAPRHPHPHNEFLNYVSGYGLIGAVFFVLLILLILRSIRRRDRLGYYLSWSVLLLAIHGQFDVLLSMPVTGCWFMLGAGALIGGGLAKDRSQKPGPMDFPGKIAGYIGICIALCMAISSLRGTLHFRNARLMLAEQNPGAAREEFRKGFRYHTNASALYTAGAVELFNFRDPERAIGYLEQIRGKFGLPMVYHSNAILARAYAVKGDYRKSLWHFDRELENYPFSILASGLRLSLLRHMQEDGKEIIEENLRFNTLLKLRGMGPEDFSRLLKNQELDDAPLKPREEHK